MMRRITMCFMLMFSLAFSAHAVAQDEASVAVAEDPELGQILTDIEGMTLYLFTNDEQGSGKSVCNDDCLANWPAFTADDPLTLPDGVDGELTQITRDDGTSQVAYNGWPLYYFVGDTAAGDVNGQGVGDVWYVIDSTVLSGGAEASQVTSPVASPVGSPEATPVAGDASVQVLDDPELGEILTDSEGMVLYTFANDEQGSGVSTCEDECLANWPAFVADDPLTLPDGVPGELTQIERPDGTMQVAYNGWPLYYFAGDTAAGDTNGHELNDVWFVVTPADE